MSYKILVENVNNKTPSAVRSEKKSCRVNTCMTVLLSFEEKTDDARACAQSGRCPFNLFEEERISILAFPGFEPPHLCDPSDQRKL